MFKFRGCSAIRLAIVEQEICEMGKEERLEELPTIRPGDRVLRRGRRPHSMLRTIAQNMPKLLKRKANKQPGK